MKVLDTRGRRSRRLFRRSSGAVRSRRAFLVRPQRAQKLAQAGLVIKSPLGDAQIAVRAVLQEAVRPDMTW